MCLSLKNNQLNDELINGQINFSVQTKQTWNFSVKAETASLEMSAQTASLQAQHYKKLIVFPSLW